MVTAPEAVGLRIALGLGRTWQAHRMEAKALQSCLSIERQNIEYQVGGGKVATPVPPSARRTWQTVPVRAVRSDMVLVTR
jgi:hypothetical protein